MAGETMALGEAIGDADALGWYGAQLLAIRWVQGRTPELLSSPTWSARRPSPRANPPIGPPSPVWRPRPGRRAEAQAAARSVVDAGLASFPERSTHLVRAFALAEAAWHLGDAGVGAAVVDDLAGLEGLPVRPSFAVTCLLGRLAGRGTGCFEAAGDLDGAIATLDQAVGDVRKLRNRPMLAVTLGELADAMVRRPARRSRQGGGGPGGSRPPGGRPRPAGPTTRPRRGPRTHRPAPVAVSMRHEGGWWLLEVGESQVKIRDLVGVRHRLSCWPIPMRPSPPASWRRPTPKPALAGQPLVDATALEATVCGGRAGRGELDDAESAADLGRVELGAGRAGLVCSRSWAG